jgi:TonB family protein
VLPHPKFTPDPEYTEEARKAREQGTVLLAVVVDENGDIRDAQVKRSLALGLDDSAMETIRRWKFEPATMEGKPVPVQLQVERNFRLLTGLRSQGRECSASRRVALEMRSRPRAAPASVTATLRQTHFFVVIQ